MLEIIATIFVYLLKATYYILVVALPVYYIVKKFYKKNKDLPSKEIVSNFYAYGLIPLLLLTISLVSTDVYFYYHFRRASVLNHFSWAEEILPQIPYNAYPEEGTMFGKLTNKAGEFTLETITGTPLIESSNRLYKSPTEYLIDENDTIHIQFETLVGYAFNNKDLLMHIRTKDKQYYWVRVQKADPYCEELNKKEYEQYLIDHYYVAPRRGDIPRCEFQLHIIDIKDIKKTDFHWVFFYHKIIQGKYYSQVTITHRLLICILNDPIIGCQFWAVSVISTLFGMLPITIYLCRKKKKEQEFEKYDNL